VSFREEFPTLAGCLSWAASVGGTYLVLGLIAFTFGWPAAFWFGLGALLSSIFALWEAGRNSEKEGGRDGSA
jgi:hypothetical protein